MTSEAWLRDVAARATGSWTGAGARSVARLAGHASLRNYWRVGEPGKGSVVVMVQPPDGAPEEISKDPASASAAGIRPFVDVQRYLCSIRVRVPEILAFSHEEGYAVLEDLGDDMIVTRLRRGDAAGPLYEAAVDALASMRAAADRAPDPTCVAFQRCYDEDLYRWELEHFVEWVVRDYKGATLSSRERSVVEAHFDQIAAGLAAQASGFTHRDYQSRNVMVLAGDVQVVIDFQDALLGPAAYDLVSLLRDSYVVLAGPFIAAMIRRYLQASALSSEGQLDGEAFRRVFDLLTVQRKLKDAGRFVFIDRRKGNPDFLAFIPTALGYVREAFGRLPELTELQHILARHVPELGPAQTLGTGRDGHVR